MRIHIISIGGAVMHNIAIALKLQGHLVSGSDDEIYDPSKSRLADYDLLPDAMGWYPEQITTDIDFCILGMHARAGNPEIERAKSLHIPIYSYPEYVARFAEDKLRIVIGGSHGKTTTTSMVMHILKSAGKDFDYLVGAKLEGFDHMVRFSDAPIMVLEGDEYLSSALDRRAKFIHYKPQLAVLTGIAWDHINVFPTFDSYLQTFRDFLTSLPAKAKLFYYGSDDTLTQLVTKTEVEAVSYDHLPYRMNEQKLMEIEIDGQWYPTSLVGTHNAQNLNAAYLIARTLDIPNEIIGASLAHFKGASKRLQLLAEKGGQKVFLDFAHAPSKVKATMDSIQEQFPEQKWIAVAELHTYSSLNVKFLPHYAHALDRADNACVFYSPHAVKMKKMEPMEAEDIRKGFQRSDLSIATNKEELRDFLQPYIHKGYSLLLMSSGTFGGTNVRELAKEFLGL